LGERQQQHFARSFRLSLCTPKSTAAALHTSVERFFSFACCCTHKSHGKFPAQIVLSAVWQFSLHWAAIYSSWPKGTSQSWRCYVLDGIQFIIDSRCLHQYTAANSFFLATLFVNLLLELRTISFYIVDWFGHLSFVYVGNLYKEL
jgi:hypothetical protein